MQPKQSASFSSYDYTLNDTACFLSAVMPNADWQLHQQNQSFYDYYGNP